MILFKLGESAVRVGASVFYVFSDALVSSLFSKTELETGFSHVCEGCLKSHCVVERCGKVSLNCD